MYGQVMELMVRDMGQLTHIECSVKRQKWMSVLQALKLTPGQREQVMANRKEHLNNLRRLYQERQELNMQVRLEHCYNSNKIKNDKIGCTALNTLCVVSSTPHMCGKC